MSNRSHDHVSAERLQAFLDGALPRRERGRVEEHVAACARCSDELEGWRAVFQELAALPGHRPAAGFRERVMASVEIGRRASFTQRLRRGLMSILPAARPEHPAGERLQDFLDGSLPATVAARVAGHVEECHACASELASWRTVYARLHGLEGFTPTAGFADRVMTAVRVPAPAAASASVPATSARAAGWRLPDWRRALVAVGRWVPRTRRAWATLAGIAVTPAVTAGLVLYTVFSHPTLTPQALASFALWELTDVFGAAWSAAAAFALDSGQLLGVDALVRTLFDAPFMLAGGALAYSIVSALALRVLYKNLSGGRRHARVSHS